MPATNYTPIQLYRSTTSGNLPLAANLNPGELALNIADNDMTMYMENASGVVKSFFNNPAALKYPTADGTSGQVIQTNGSGVLSFGVPPSTALTNNTRQAVTSSATTTINLNSGNVIDLTMAANITTLSFTNVPASGTPILIQIVVKNASNGAVYTIAWPNSVYWSGQYAATTIATAQTAPTLATGANGVTVIALLTTDGGTKWRGWVEATIPGGVQQTAYAWGYNSFGELGINNTLARSSPVQIGALNNWLAIDGGRRTSSVVALKTDGTIWSWGANYSGCLGQNSTSPVHISSPTQIGALNTWVQVSMACNSSNQAAIKGDGTLWAWGDNAFGQLGQNNTSPTAFSSPIQVGALTNWAKVSFGRSSVLAIKTDGTLWSWGRNNGGNVGNSSIANVSSPIQIGALTNWSEVSGGDFFSLAIKTDGTLWAWGGNYRGRLGTNNTNDYSSPVQIGAGTTWASIAAGVTFSMAVKTDGTAWAWGGDPFGMGLNNNVYVSSPTQIGALTNWSKLSPGESWCLALKTDGTLWSWGVATDGRTGKNNSTPNTSSPTQIGALTTWGAIGTGARVGFGMITIASSNPA